MRMWKHRSQLKALAKAKRVAFGPVGIGGNILPETRAFDELVDAGRDDPAGIARKLEKLVRDASPAGKVYAAEALTSIDPPAGQRAWERLTGEKDEVMSINGCIPGRTTLAEYATQRLATGNASV
jgi:hypothetical protein